MEGVQGLQQWAALRNVSEKQQSQRWNESAQAASWQTEPEGIDVGEGKDLACARTAVSRRGAGGE